MVSLTATPDPSSLFTGWFGDADCTDGSVTMDAAHACIATFTLKQYGLDIDFQGSGTGTVNLNPPDTDLTTDGSQTYDHGTVVSLTAFPDASSLFTGWSGDGDCADGSVTMDTAHACTAVFTLKTFTVTPLAPVRGCTVSPDTAQTVAYGETRQFTFTPADDCTLSGVGGTCGGSLAGDVFTTDPVTANCTVEGLFSCVRAGYLVTRSRTGRGRHHQPGHGSVCL